jgi:hypothetical protein
VLLAFDADAVRKPQVAAAQLACARALIKAQYAVEFERWKEADGKGIDNLLAAGEKPEGLSGEDAMAAIKDVAEQAGVDTTASETASSGPFFIHSGRILRRIVTRDGDRSAIPLCNFSARMVEEQELDDGVQTSRSFAIEGSLATGEALPRISVPSAEYSEMDWVLDSWGARAVVNAGRGMKDDLRCAIQSLSGNAHRQHVYTHTGWRKLEGG